MIYLILQLNKVNSIIIASQHYDINTWYKYEHNYNNNKVKNYILDNAIALYKKWPLFTLK